jgi:hypothetical protein
LLASEGDDLLLQGILLGFQGGRLVFQILPLVTEAHQAVHQAHAFVGPELLGRQGGRVAGQIPRYSHH